MKKNIIAIVQARMGSTRLPGKVLIDIKGKTVLHHVIDRLRQSKNIDDIIIATTTLERDNSIVEEANKIKCKHFRGSEDNVLDRYYEVAKLYKADIVIRITSDCPLIDPIIVDNMIEFYEENNYEILSNSPQDNSIRTYPRGLDVEIFSFEKLKEAKENATHTYQLEHVTPYIYENSKNKYFYTNEKNYSDYRLTLDTDEDLKLIKEIYSKLYVGKHDFYMNEIINLLIDNPSLISINNNINQKSIKE